MRVEKQEYNGTISAAQAIGEYLQSPDDLMTIPAFRKKLKASIYIRLKSGVKEQLAVTRERLRKPFRTRDDVQAIRDEIVTIDRMCSDPQNVVSTSDQISRVSMVHRNFEQTEEMVNNPLEMSSRLDSIKAMLATDLDDLLGPAPNLLPIHLQLTQLENFRNETMHQAKKTTAQSRNNLARRFERLTGVIEEFDDYIMKLSRNILPLARAGHIEVIVKIAKIAEIEGREDEKAIAIRLVTKAAKLDAASKFRSMQANARIIKHYRSRIMKNIAEAINAKFEAAYLRDENDPVGFLENLGWLYQDLIAIERDVVACFPPHWDVYSHFVREYHKSLNSTVQRLIASEPDATALLTLHAWLKEYKSSMNELQIPPELLEPPLLGGNDQLIIDAYLKPITEVTEFTSRAEPPELDAVILFQMVNQQVDVAMESGQGMILAGLVSETNRVMRGVQDQWTRLSTRKAPLGLVDYVIALANDQIKSADYAEALSARLEPLVSERYRVTINERLNDAKVGYLDVANKCTQTLIDIIFNDLRRVTKQLFQVQWYDGIVVQVVVTMRDYMKDCQTYLNATLLELLVEELLDAFLVAYLTALANTQKLHMPAAAERIKDDVAEARKFFSTLKPAKELESYFEVVEMVLSLLETSKSLAFLSFWSFAKVHGPNLAFVEGLMKARGDLDRSSVNEVMDSIKRKVKEGDLRDREKITIEGTSSRLLRTGE
ncbi:exocyst complex component Sec6 [Lactarius hengduanensis]|nr:exocyst complex component Sec6 [Lactarius hengduanensis]